MVNRVRFSELLNLLGAPKSSQDFVVTNLSEDSREVQSGHVFLALSGFQCHGMDYAEQAQEKGAMAIITEKPIDKRPVAVKSTKNLTIPVYEVVALSEKLGTLASAFYQHPSQQLKVTAVTGTNGKTSTAFLLTQALNQLGQKAAYMGTLGVGDLADLIALKNTTPSALTIQKNLAMLRDRGYRHVCMEVSSHGLSLGRLNGTRIDTAIYTNLSQDHLDFHLTMSAYAAAKQKLFTDFKLRHAVLNVADNYAQSWLQKGLPVEQISGYAVVTTEKEFAGICDLTSQCHQAQQVSLTANGMCFEWTVAGEKQTVIADLLGAFNVENLLAVIAGLSGFNIPNEQIAKVIAGLTPVPGRMNSLILMHKKVTVVVDYAHTPDALSQVLTALRDHCQKQLWCVFGCGGNRDSGKRPQMGQIAEMQADCVVVTDDNPRFESATQITADIAFGMQKKPRIIHDRKEAIEYALEHANDGDIILIAGKGHETTQQINDHYIHFNDMQVVQAWQGVAA